MPQPGSRRHFIQAAAAAVGSVTLPRVGSAEPASQAVARPRIAAIDYRSDNATFTDPATVALHAKYAFSLIGMLPSQSSGTGRQFCVDLKAANPSIKIGQYTILSQMYDSGGTFQQLWESINSGDGQGHDWWARAALNSPVDPGGKTKPVGYEQYTAWSVNQTRFAPADANGKRWPQLCAQGYHDLTLRQLWTAGVLNFVFNDNVWWHPYPESDGNLPAHALPDGRCADYRLNGSNNDPLDAGLGRSWRKGYVDYWAALDALMPGVKICANADNDRSTYVSCLSTPELSEQADYAFIEGLSGKSWSPATFTTMDNVMLRYRSQLQHVKKTVFVNTYVDTVADTLGRTLQKARFGLGLSMLDDGYACIADQPGGATMRPFWFDELEAAVGSSIEPGPTKPLANGMWMRKYRHGCVVLNPMDNGGRWMGNGGSITLQRQGGVVTLTRPLGVPPKKAGDRVRIQDCNDPSFNGVFLLTEVTATTLRWAQAGSDALWAQPALRGFFQTLTSLDLSGQGYRRLLGTQDSHNNYLDGGTSQNNGLAVDWLTLWSNDAIVLLTAQP